MRGRAQRRDDGGARWRHELAGDRCRRESDIACLAQVDDSGDGNGHEAVGAANGSVALGERLDNDVLNTQVIEADGNRADVDDGVDGAYLVEHDSLGRFAVGLGLGGGERGKDGEGAALSAIGQLRPIDDGGDVCQRAVVMMAAVMMILVLMGVLVAMDVLVLVMMFILAMVVMVVVLMLMRVLCGRIVAVEPCHIVVMVLELLCQLNVEVAGVDAVLVRACHGNLKAVDRQRCELLAQMLLAGAQVEQGRDGHIAADARGSVDDKRMLMVGHEMLLSGRGARRRSDD